MPRGRDRSVRPYLLDNRLFTRATQEVFLLPKRHECNPRGIYLLGIHLGYTSGVTVYTSWMTYSSHVLPKRYTCYPRGMHVTQEVYTSWIYLLGMPLGLHAYLLHYITRCVTQEVCMHPRGMDTRKCNPRGITKRYTQEVYTSWVTYIPLGYTSWNVVIPLGLHASWVYLLGHTMPLGVQGVLPM